MFTLLLIYTVSSLSYPETFLYFFSFEVLNYFPLIPTFLLVAFFEKAHHLLQTRTAKNIELGAGQLLEEKTPPSFFSGHTQSILI